MGTTFLPAPRASGVANNVRIPSDQETLSFRGAFGDAEAESGTPARLQFSWPRSNNSAMAACESPTIAMPTLLRNRS